MSYFLRVAAWLSQGANCVFLNGSHDQTVSARAYLNRNDPMWRWAYLTINAVFFWQEDHCLSSQLADVEYARSVLGNSAHPLA